MWTSPKYQTRIAADRQVDDQRMAAADRRADTATDPNDDRPAASSATRRRFLSLPTFRSLRA